MASFGCVVLKLTVYFIAVVAYLINPIDSGAATTIKPILLFANSTENASVVITRSRPAGSENAEKLLQEAEFKILLEKRIPQDRLSREVNSVDDFWKKRNKLADSEVKKLLGSSLLFNRKEAKANKIILSKKHEEYDKTLSATELFPPSISFVQAKNLIEQADIYKIIKKLPKGAALCNFLINSVPFSFMFYTLTYTENLYFRYDDKLQLKFSKTKPGPSWRLLSEIRKTPDAEFVEEFNVELKQSLSLTNLDAAETNEFVALQKLSDVLDLYTVLTSYKPNFQKTLQTALETLYNDNIMYAELGYDFSQLYGLDGKAYSHLDVLKLCETILENFIKTHKDFIGARFVYVPITNTNLENLGRFRKIAAELWEANPKLIAGFGLIRKLDTQRPLSYWVEELLKFPKEIKFFFNAGMTNNWGVDTDYDLLDALALNTAAIGEGLALNKHPLVLEELRKSEVPVQFSPIAAQMLYFVKDLRTHPLTSLVAADFPVVIVNTGATAWNASGLSYDWYEAYMAMTPRFCDIRCLKQFALNSWLYCTLSSNEKKGHIKAWELKWDKFIDYVIDKYE